MRVWTLSFFIAILLHLPAFGQTTEPNTTETRPTHELFDSLDYPELQVVPSASHRLELEANDERDNWWHIHWPMQVSAVSTLSLGFLSKSYSRLSLDSDELSDFDTARLGAKVLGLSWLTATVLVGMKKPYLSSYQNLADIKGKTRRSLLLRERLAEEALEKQAELMKKLRTASVASNVAIALYINSYSAGDGKIFAVASAALGLLPLWIKDRHVFTYEKHMDYKRNIYAPLTGIRLIPRDTGTGVKIQPLLNMAWRF